MVVSPLATQPSPKNKRRLFAEARQNSLQKLSIIFDHGNKNGKWKTETIDILKVTIRRQTFDPLDVLDMVGIPKSKREACFPAVGKLLADSTKSTESKKKINN